MTTAAIIARIRADMFVEPEGAYARGYNAGHMAIIRWLTEAPVLAGLAELRDSVTGNGRVLNAPATLVNTGGDSHLDAPRTALVVPTFSEWASAHEMGGEG